MPLSSVAQSLPLSVPQAADTVLKSVRSVERNDVARALANLFISKVAKIDIEVALALDEYYSLVFAHQNPDLPQGFMEKQARQKKLNALSQKITLQFRNRPLQQIRFAEMNAKLSWTVDFIAPMLAKENFLDIARAAVQDFYERRKTDADAKLDLRMLPAFNETLFFDGPNHNGNGVFTSSDTKWIFSSIEEFLEVVPEAYHVIILTPHPIEYKSLAGNRALMMMGDAGREACLAANDNMAASMARLEASVDNVIEVDFTPKELVDKNLPKSPLNEKIRRLTVREEIETIHLTMRQMWKHSPQKAGTFNRTMERVAGKGYTEEQRLEFNPRLKVGSWGPDKDGHDGKKAEHVLMEEIMLNLQNVSLVLEDIEAAKKLGARFNHPSARTMIRRLEQARDQLALLDQAIIDKTNPENGDIVLSQNEFDELSRKRAMALTLPGEAQAYTFPQGEEALEKILEHSFYECEGKAQQAVYNLLNNVRDMGLGPQMELRETSDVYSDVMAFLLARPHPATGEVLKYPDYDETATDAQDQLQKRTAFLSKYLRDKPSDMAERIEAFLAEIDGTEKLRDYDDAHPEVIAYHTLKRVQEALRNPTMINKSIMAEFKGSSNMLEMLLLQKGLARAVGSERFIDIVPLFEEYDTLTMIPERMMECLGQKEYRQHLLALAGGDPSKITIEIMIAHSDNTKRAGNPASRAAIHRAHQDWLVANWSKIQKQFAKDGVDIDELDIKIHFNEGKSSHHVNRFGTRSHTAMVDAFDGHRFTKQTVQGPDGFLLMWMESTYKRYMATHYRNAYRAIAYAEATGSPVNGKNSHIERVVEDAFMRTYPDFTKAHYDTLQNYRGEQLAHPVNNFAAQKLIACGSRPPERATAKKKEPVLGLNGTARIDITKNRAIGDAEGQFDSQVHAGWFAYHNIEAYLVEGFQDDPDALQELQHKANLLDNRKKVLFDDQGKLTPQGGDALYRLSPLYREVVDIAAYGLVVSDMESLFRYYQDAEDRFGAVVEDDTKKYNEQLMKDNLAAAKIVLKSFGHEPIDTSHRDDDAMMMICFARHLAEEKVLPHLKGEISFKRDVVDVAKHQRHEILMTAWAERNERKARGEPAFTHAELMVLRYSTISRNVLSHGHSSAGDRQYLASLNYYKRGQKTAQLVAA